MSLEATVALLYYCTWYYEHDTRGNAIHQRRTIPFWQDLMIPFTVIVYFFYD
jgi:hypothetical protein